jgi:hypothetical protein
MHNSEHGADAPPVMDAQKGENRMAYEYDRLEKEDGGGSFLMGLLAGTVLGAGLGMLFAPKAGSELRNQLSESAGRLKHTAGDTYGTASEKVSQIMDRGREAYDRARSSMGGGTTGTTGSPNIGTSGSAGAGATGSVSGNLGSTGTGGSLSGTGSGTSSFSPTRNS